MMRNKDGIKFFLVQSKKVSKFAVLKLIAFRWHYEKNSYIIVFDVFGEIAVHPDKGSRRRL